MNEIEYRLKRAQFYRECLTEDIKDNPIGWCLVVGLWETASWICNKNTKSPPILDWLEPGVRTG